MSVKIKQEVTSKYKAKTNTYDNFTLVGILENLYKNYFKKKPRAPNNHKIQKKTQKP